MQRGFLAVTGVLLVLAFSLSSYISIWGGDSFTIQLNNKLLVDQHLYGDKSVKTISLKEANANDELKITFRHCGVAGKNKILTVKNGNNKVLKQWSFTDQSSSMTCKVKEILSLDKGSASLQLYYTSEELPKGQILASISTENGSTVKK